MNKVKGTVLGLAAFFAVALAPTSVMASTSDDLQSVDSQFSTSANELLSDFQTASTSGDASQLDKSLSDFQTAATEAKAEFNKISSESSSEGWKNIANEMTQAVDGMSSAAEGLRTSIKSQDQEAYYKYATEFQAAIDSYQTAIDKANQYMADNPLDSGDSQYALWFGLLGLSLLCLVGAIVMVVLTRKQDGSTSVNNKTTSLKDLRRNVLIGAGIFVIGAAIPAVQYWYGTHNRNADGTFTYYIFYWPLIIGAGLFVIGLVQYLFTYLKLKKAGSLAKDKSAPTPPVQVPEIGSKQAKK